MVEDNITHDAKTRFGWGQTHGIEFDASVYVDQEFYNVWHVDCGNISDEVGSENIVDGGSDEFKWWVFLEALRMFEYLKTFIYAHDTTRWTSQKEKQMNISVLCNKIVE